MRKKDRFLVLFLLIFIFLQIFCGCSHSSESMVTSSTSSTAQKGINQQQDVLEPRPSNGQIIFRLADNLSSDNPTVQGDREFARLVEEKSNGRIKIIVYPNAALGDENSEIAQVRLGGIDIARVNAASLAEISNKMTVLALPYLFRDSKHMWNVLNGPIGDEILDSLKQNQITGLAYYDSGSRNFYIKKPVSSVSDIKGMRIRVLKEGIFGDFIKQLGATPVPMNLNEIYDSMQQGDIEGAENNWSTYYYTNHYRVAKYYVLDEHTRNPDMLVINSNVLSSLSKEDQQIIISSAKESADFQRKKWAETEKSIQETVIKNGTVIIKINDEEKALLQKSMDPLYEKYGKDYKDLIKRIKNTD